MVAIGAIPGFVVRPPHLALCILMRLLTSYGQVRSCQKGCKSAAKLTSFILRLQAKAELYYPSLTSIISQLRDECGEDGIAFGEHCRDRLSSLCSAHSLSSFMKLMKRDLEGANGPSPLLRSVIPECKVPAMSRESLFGLFFRKCIVTFQEMSFDQICSLALEVTEYCPSMLDQEQRSVYLRDHDHLESHVDALLQEIKQGDVPDSIEEDLKALDPLSTVFPKPILLQHEVAIVRKEVTSAFSFLRRFCNLSISHGSNFLMNEKAPSTGILHRIHILMLKMASMQIDFEHVQESMVVLEEAFESARMFNDDVVLQSCLVLLLEVLIQTFPAVIDPQQVPLDKKERFQYIDQLLRRCREKAIEMKTPHIIAFCEICRVSLGVKNQLINNHSAHSYEVCKVVNKTILVLARMKCLVTTGTTVSNLKTHTNDENAPEILHALFKSASHVFGPSVKNATEIVESMVDQAVGTLQLLSAVSWKSNGSLVLSQMMALTLEGVLKKRCKVSDRAAALAHLSILQAQRKGTSHGLKILSYAQQKPELANELSLKIAQEYIAMERGLWSSSENREDCIKDGFQSLSSVSSHSMISCMESQIMCELQNIRGLLTLKRTDAAKKEAERLMELHDMLGLESSKAESHLLYAEVQYQLGSLDLKSTELLKDLTKTQDSPVALTLFAKLLLKLESKAHGLVSSLLKSIFPMVISQTSLDFQGDFMVFLVSSMMKNDQKSHQEADRSVLLSVLKHGLELNSYLHRVDKVQEILTLADELSSRLEDQTKTEELMSELTFICSKNGMEMSQHALKSMQEETEDEMELD